MELKKIAEKLYSRSSNMPLRPHHFDPLDPRGLSLQKSKTVNPQDQILGAPETTQAQKRYFLKGLFAVIFLFLTFLCGYGIYVYRKASFSPEKVLVSFDLPEEVEVGRNFSFKVLYHNNNRADLEECFLKLSFPDSLEILESDKQSLEASSGFVVYKMEKIVGGENGIITLQGRLTEKKEALIYPEISFSYKVKGKTKIITKKEKQGLKIAAPKLFLELEATRQAASGDFVEYLVRLANNTAENISGVDVVFKYPPGFSFTRSVPDSVPGSSHIFRFPTISAKENLEISVKGTLSGYSLENKIVSVEAGFREGEKLTVLAQESAQTEMITSPLLITQDIDFTGGAEGSLNFDPGDLVGFKVKYENTSDIPMKEVVVSVDLEGKVVNPDAVKVEDGGSFDPVSDRITWRGSTTPELNLMNPKQKGEFEFSLGILSRLPAESLEDKNFEISSVAQIDSPDVPTPIGANKLVSSNKKTLKINTKVILEAFGFYNDDLVSNAGPLPPKVGEETTYSIHWKVANINNDLTKSSIKAVLPEYISWKNKFYPARAGEISYNERTREVIWNINNIPAQTGTQLEAKEIVFQVGLTPNKEQIGSSPILVGESIFTGTDAFTQKQYILKKDLINITLPSDESIGDKEVKVVE